MKKILGPTLLSFAALFTALVAEANVFSLVQSSGPDLETPQAGEVFEFEIHYEQLTELVSLGFSVRTTGGVKILSAAETAGCFGPFPPIVCDLISFSQAVPGFQLNVTPILAGPWAYISGMTVFADAGTIEDSMGPPGGLLGTVTVQYASPGTLEIFENASTDDQSYRPFEVVVPSSGGVAFPTAALPPRPLVVRFVDPSGDADPPIDVDLVSLELAFDPVTGDYEIVWEADPAHPFVGTFRLNANLYNVDTGSSAQDPAFFQDTFNDVTLTAPQTVITLTGNNPRLTSWSAGDRVAASCPDPLGCPTGGVFFQTAVGPLSGSAVGLDALVPQFSVIGLSSTAVPTLSAPAGALLVAFMASVTHLVLRKRRGSPAQ